MAKGSIDRRPECSPAECVEYSDDSNTCVMSPRGGRHQRVAAGDGEEEGEMVVGEKERKGGGGGWNVLAAAHALDTPRRLPYLAPNQRQNPASLGVRRVAPYLAPPRRSLAFRLSSCAPATPSYFLLSKSHRRIHSRGSFCAAARQAAPRREAVLDHSPFRLVSARAEASSSYAAA